MQEKDVVLPLELWLTQGLSVFSLVSCLYFFSLVAQLAADGESCDPICLSEGRKVESSIDEGLVR